MSYSISRMNALRLGFAFGLGFWGAYSLWCAAFALLKRLAGIE